MLGPIFTITRNTFVESIRQPIFVVMVIGGSLALTLNVQLSAYTMDDDNRLMIGLGLGMLLLCGMILSALLSAGVLTREIDNKTVLTVISKPIGRPAFIVGKYVGVAGAIGLAMMILSLVFLLTVRHKVLSGAADKLDWPVIAFGFSALIIAVAVGVWGNYFYGWVFNSTFAAVLAAGLALGYVMVLMIDKQWQFQPITTEFLNAPITNYGEREKSLAQVMLLIVLVTEAVWVISAIAIAASTRLGQVMTLLTCTGALVAGLISDPLLGKLSETSVVAWTAYAIVPNLHQLFLVDALSQGHAIPLGHLAAVSGYAALYIVAALALGVALFQTRETG